MRKTRAHKRRSRKRVRGGVDPVQISVIGERALLHNRPLTRQSPAKKELYIKKVRPPAATDRPLTLATGRRPKSSHRSSTANPPKPNRNTTLKKQNNTSTKSANKTTLNNSAIKTIPNNNYSSRWGSEAIRSMPPPPPTIKTLRRNNHISIRAPNKSIMTAKATKLPNVITPNSLPFMTISTVNKPPNSIATTKTFHYNNPISIKTLNNLKTSKANRLNVITPNSMPIMTVTPDKVSPWKNVDNHTAHEEIVASQQQHAKKMRRIFLKKQGVNNTRSKNLNYSRQLSPKLLQKFYNLHPDEKARIEAREKENRNKNRYNLKVLKQKAPSDFPNSRPIINNTVLFNNAAPPNQGIVVTTLPQPEQKPAAPEGLVIPATGGPGIFLPRKKLIKT